MPETTDRPQAQRAPFRQEVSATSVADASQDALSDPLERSTLIDPMARPGAGHVRSRSEQLGLLYAASTVQSADFADLVGTWAQALGGRPSVRAGVKNMDRSVEKGGAEGVVDQRDTLAGTVMFDDLPGLWEGVQGLDAALGATGASLVRLKNRIEEPLTRDLLANVRLPSGLVVELQLHLSDVIAIKMGEGGERAPKDVDAVGQGSGAPLDAQGIVMGQKEMHTHDVYDYARILEALSADLEGSSFVRRSGSHQVRGALQRMATVQQVGDEEALPQARSNKSRALRIAAVKTKLTALRAELDRFMTALMGEVWAGAIAAPGAEEAYEALKGVDPVTSPAKQDLDRIEESHEGTAEWEPLLGAQRAKATAAFRKLDQAAETGPDQDAMDDLGAIARTYAGRLQGQASTKAEKLGAKVDPSRVTSLVKLLGGLADKLGA